MNAPTATRVPSPTEQVAAEAPADNVPAVHRAPEQLPAGQEVQPDAEPALPHKALQGYGDVAGAIAAVMAEIEGVQKGGLNKFHDYKYARMQDILTALTPLLGKNGLAIFQTEHHRSLFDGGNVIAVQYRFTIAHKSGQVWPEHPLQTGMSFCRDKNAKFDDKALNKCHTAARKYFLLALFQIPTEDEDADEGPKKSAGNAPVPGPTGHMTPHRIEPARGETPDSWAEKYEAAVRHAKSPAELAVWDNLNDSLLASLSEKKPDRYGALMAAVSKMQAGLAVATKAASTKPDPISTGQPAEVPSPATTFVRPADAPDAGKDPDKFLNWAAGKLAQTSTAEELDLIWNELVDPSADGLMKPDFEELQGLYAKNQKRLGAD